MRCKPETMVGLDVSLVVRPSPEPGESLTGFFARVCQENWLSRAVMLERMTGLKTPKFALQNGGLEPLARLTGNEVEELEARQYAPVNGDTTLRKFLGREVNHSHLKTTAMRYCPVCLGVKGYHHAIWELRLIEACPIHGLRLIGKDPRSGKEISWDRPDLVRTRLGELPLADEMGHKRELADGVLFGQRAIYELCGVDHGGEEVLPQLPVEIRQMSFDEALKVIVVLGAAALEAPDFNGARRIYAHDIDMLKFSEAGVSMLINWPARFEQYLERELEKNGAIAASAGLNRLFENMFKRMRKLKDGHGKDFLQNGAKKYFEREPIPVNRKNSNFLRGDQLSGRKYVTLSEAAQLLGVTTYRARHIAEEEGWIERGKKTKHVPNLIHRSLIEGYEIDEPETLAHSEAMRRLGVSKNGFKALVNHGLVILRNNQTDGRSATRVLASEVDSLLERLRGMREHGADPKRAAEELDVRELANKLFPPRYSIGFLLERVLDGTLKPTRWDNDIPGIYALRFAASKVTQYRIAVGTKVPSTIKAANAVRRYGYALDELRWFVSEKLIEVKHKEPKFADCRLSSRELQAFSLVHVLDRQVNVERYGGPLLLVAESTKLGRLFRTVD